MVAECELRSAAPITFPNSRFYLFGYLESDLQAQAALVAALDAAGASSSTTASAGAADAFAYDYLVVSDQCSSEVRAAALDFGRPVLCESAVLEQLGQSKTTTAPAPVSEPCDILPNRLRNCVSLDEMLDSSEIVDNLSDSDALASDARQEGIRPRPAARHHSIHRMQLSSGSAAATATTALAALVADSEVLQYPAAPIQPGLSQTKAPPARGRQHDGRSSDSSDSHHNTRTDAEVSELDIEEYHERAEWQKMLKAALTGEVVDSEKKRLNTQADGSLFNLTDNEYAEHLSDLLQSRDYRQLFRRIHVELWLECRAAIRGRTPLQERQTLESLRAIHTDTTLRAVTDFSADRIDAPAAVDFSMMCLAQLQKLLRRVDYVEGMYPTLHALAEAKPMYASQAFQEKLAAITSWTNISVRLGLLHTMIQRWTGSRELNLYSTASLGLYASTTAGIGTGQGASSSDITASTTGVAIQQAHSLSQKRPSSHTPFVERLLKESGMKMIFEQKILTELEQVVQSARRDLIENSVQLTEMSLPVTSGHMQELLRFPPRLLQTCLLIRLQSAENLTSPTMAQVDQLLDDIRDSLSVACRVKRSFNALTAPTNGWNPGVQLDPEYDRTLHSCLQTYFRLLHRKLSISGEIGGVKVFEVLENQWPFLLSVVRDIEGGQHELALRYCQQARFLVQLWTRVLARLLKGPPVYDSMSARELGKWFNQAMQSIRSPILRGQRLMRTIQNAVANSTDYVFDDPFPLLAQLVDSKHVLIYTSGEWESHGVYIIGSQALLQKPQLARELLTSCVVDEVLARDQYRDCYLLVIRTDAEFNWTGTSVMPRGGVIRYQALELNPGQMRLISPGVERLERHRQWLERINIAAELQSWETATAVTDEIIDNWVRSRRAGGHMSSHSSNTSDRRSSKRSEAMSDFCYGGEDLEDLDGARRGDYAALRPSLELYDRQLARINTPSQPRPGGAQGVGTATAADASSDADVVGEDDPAEAPPAPARVRELIRAHDPLVQREWSLLKYGITRLMDALTQVPDMQRTLHLGFHERKHHEGFRGARHHAAGEAAEALPDIACRGENCELLEHVQECFSFVSNTAARAARLLDLRAERYVRLALLHMCVGWCGFITEDCMANEKRTFRWAVQALEYTMRASKHNTVQVLPPTEWRLIKSQVAGCLTLMISHFDILGARNEESLSKETQKGRGEQALRLTDDPNSLLSLDGIGANYRTHLMQRQRVLHSQQVDVCRDEYLHDNDRIGRVLEVTARPGDQTLRLLASSSSNITIRWQIGHPIGRGAFGSVYNGYNIDTGEIMAVKEIRFPNRPVERAAAGAGGLAGANNGGGGGADKDRDHPGHKIVREMEVMSMLQHPNIVTYYGIEVHREKVYLFMENCTRGSLAQFVRDQGRLDEETAKVFTVQMLRGLEYLHASGICHRDIKCDNTLLDDSMNIKLVDFGAAKVLDRQSLAGTRRTRVGKDNGVSLTGTPMYMAPEVILGGSMANSANSAAPGVATSATNPSAAASAGTTIPAPAAPNLPRPAKLGAQDIWSLGCCVVEMVTGKPPWAHLDNEWAIMYQVVSGDPPLPDPSDISPDGMRFIKRCFARQPADRPQATELLKDEWLASTLRAMEQLEARGQSAGRLTAGGSADYLSSLGLFSSDHLDESDIEPGISNAGAHSQSIGRGERQTRHMHSISSVGSVGSASNPTNRSRAESMSRRYTPGDLRFITSATGGPSGEAMLTMMDRLKGSSGGAGGGCCGERSPTNASPFGALMGTRSGLPSANLLHNASCPLVSSLGQTPGSPNSATSLHAAAWPFNKDAAGIAAVLPPAQGGLAPHTTPGAGGVQQMGHAAGAATPWGLLNSGGMLSFATSSSADANSRAAVPALGSQEHLNSTGEELVAIYSSPSAIFHVLSGSAGSSVRADSAAESVSTPLSTIPLSLQRSSGLRNEKGEMGSPGDLAMLAGSVSQFSISSGSSRRNSSSTGSAASRLSDLGANEASMSNSTERLSSDVIQDLSDTTRKAVVALLSMPLEGADVAGVSGWLGEGNTPMEMLNADEVKETVATTSHIIVRQREQQLRRQQEIRHMLHRQQFHDTMTRQGLASNGTELDGGDVLELGPSIASDSRLAHYSTRIQSTLGDAGSQPDSSSLAAAARTYDSQKSEPPVLFPLPSDEE
ncbi:Suppressor of Sensor Kinase (SLN1) [Coemansia sp. RSA 2320]|nr:Suppressor of Sensor Kinase (SLN1) [Coemansia sp. RSA 2320]